MELIEISRADLSGELESLVQALLKCAFLEGVPTETDYYSTYGIPELILILREGRQVIGHLAVYDRQVKIGRETLKIGMLGGIAISPGHRRRGYSRLLVRHAHDYLKGRMIPFSILFAYEPRVYESNGYSLMKNTTRFLDVDDTWKTFVICGGMYAELLQRPWPNRLVNLCGRVV